MKFNSSARFNRKSFNSEKLFDAGIHDAGTVTNSSGGEAINDIVNGGFETGDFTGWTPQIDPLYTEAAYEVSANPRSGSWAAKLTAMYSTGPGGLVTITQDAPNSNDTLTFYYKTTNWNWIGAAITVKISDGVNPDITDSITTTAGGAYTLKSYDITSLTNRDTTCEIELGCYCLAMPNTLIVYFDDISSTHNAPETFEMEFQFTHERTVENTPALAMELAPATITATIENSPEVWSSVFIDTTPVFSVPFDGGSSEIVIGDIITGVTSGATGTVTLVVVTGGTWGAGTAAGYIIVENITGTFLIGEHIDAWTPVLNIGSTTGDATTTYYLPFTAGTDEFIVGSVVTGALSGATGTVISVDVTSGDWGTGDAEGYIRVINTSVATFINGEDIDGSHAEATDNSEQLYTLWYNCGTSALTAGKTVTGVVSGATAFILTVNLLCGEWGTNNAKGILDVKNVVGTFRKGELIADGPIGAPGTGVARVLELPAFIYTPPVSNVNTEPKPGTTLTGDTSGATGPVSEVIITSGTYGGGDAAGYILVTPDIPFVALETMTGRVPDWQVAIVSGDTTRVTPKVIERSCWKSIDEVYWQASLLLDGLYAFSDVAGFKELYIDMPDHTATSQRVFYGFIPNQGIVQNPGDNTTRLTAYSHAYNLANQFIPDAYRDTVEWVPSGATGYVTFSDPSVPITAFLGGSLWNLTTGIQPQNILTITDWGTSDIPIRGFAWGPEVNKWQAIQEMADYCGYVFEVQYDSSQDCAVANFCAVDDIDTYLGVPAAVTFDKGDASKYVLNVSKERRGTEMINRVRVQGRRNKRILNFVEGVTKFTAGHTVVDGLTGAEATIISCTKTAGAWGGTAIGYLIISYDRTGDFVHDSTIIDALGAGFGQATMQGNSVIYETYDEYTHSVESPAVTNLEERARERFFQLEEEYDSTPLIEAKCLAYYDMYALDPTPYNVTFRDRCDLRLWQKVKLTSFTEIPEDWMRIVSIRYTQRSGGAVEVSCTLNNASYVIAQRKMRRSLRNNDVTEIEKIVKSILAKKEVKVGEALKVQGEGITIELQDGEKIVVSRAPE